MADVVPISFTRRLSVSVDDFSFKGKVGPTLPSVDSGINIQVDIQSSSFTSMDTVSRVSKSVNLDKQVPDCDGRFHCSPADDGHSIVDDDTASVTSGSDSESGIDSTPESAVHTLQKPFKNKQPASKKNVDFSNPKDELSRKLKEQYKPEYLDSTMAEFQVEQNITHAGVHLSFSGEGLAEESKDSITSTFSEEMRKTQESISRQAVMNYLQREPSQEENHQFMVQMTQEFPINQ
ncbi:uncharacterized protein LOC106153468 [Lingula anatina]|uniref:Uncharacterized protein LOC106153468 n=1 Tax=Lingula anatina TaxID=7574 RepID=A0A1S3HA16_LINAN|nr:uncharacterized protein LOC106153468 [Lingula anatina]XP_013382861.1 uncharacterized protein LOC106153468 [Lingula anatina]XP_013382862.1 uncharacterized protein LOC106153468 [Lingula anatina]XP_013382863.1 uncharacterized protein LOC106153468 [Lingula anatina]|eukprot:XP_013382860.1 uncharacterized protein LOC106153468 [Lingula anatina]